MIRILVADDHPVVRAGLKELISEDSEMEVIGEASNGEEVLSMVDSSRYDVVVLDITMPGESGLEVLKHLKKTKPKLPVLILSIHSEDMYAIRALKAGASGYLTKATANEDLVKAIREVAGGGKYVSPVLAKKLAASVPGGVDRLAHETLSDREFQVFRMLAEGQRMTEIGKELSLSPKTISTYRGRILEKMHLKSDSDITRYAIANQMLG